MQVLLTCTAEQWLQGMQRSTLRPEPLCRYEPRRGFMRGLQCMEMHTLAYQGHCVRSRETARLLQANLYLLLAEKSALHSCSALTI